MQALIIEAANQELDEMRGFRGNGSKNAGSPGGKTMMLLTNLLTNMLRLGGLVLALAILSGCGDGGSIDGLEPAHRELEALGLVHDQGLAAYENSLELLYAEAIADGDAGVIDLFIRGGLMRYRQVQDFPQMAQEMIETSQTNWRAEISTATDLDSELRAVLFRLMQNLEADPGFLDGVTEVAVAADPVAASRQWDSEAAQLTLDDALSDVPDSYHSVITDTCGGGFPLYMIGLCVETNVDVIVNIVEQPPGEREQFGMWIRETAADPTGFGGGAYTVVAMIAEASGGAIVCVSSFTNNSRRQDLDVRGAGYFNDDGVLIMSGSTAVVYERGGVERLVLGGAEYTRVSAPDPVVLDHYQYCT